MESSVVDPHENRRMASSLTPSLTPIQNCVENRVDHGAGPV